MSSVFRKMFATALCGLLIAAGFYVLAFGAAIFCCAPNDSGAGFWQAEKFWYGILPMIAGLVVLRRGSRVLIGTFVRRWNLGLVSCALCLFAILTDVIVFQQLRRRSVEAQITLSYDPRSGIFNWGSGEIQLPSGFRYERLNGIDTIMGRFTSDDGGSGIQHDIGEFAAEHGSTGRIQVLTKGSRVRIVPARRAESESGSPVFLAVVSFPDSGCATFRIFSEDQKQAAVLTESIARSFRPEGWLPPWVRPLLPEVLRTDCRYRLEPPFERWN